MGIEVFAPPILPFFALQSRGLVLRVDDYSIGRTAAKPDGFAPLESL
jgi:hypothetical protein